MYERAVIVFKIYIKLRLTSWRLIVFQIGLMNMLLHLLISQAFLVISDHS